MTLAASALTTLATVLDELDLSSDGGVVDARLERYIRSASSLVAVILGSGRSRELHRATHTEAVAGFDDPRLLLRHTPIASITSITIDGDVVDAADYVVDDADAGIVMRVGSTWPSAMLTADDVVGAGVPGTERKAISVVYVAGWVTPTQETGQLARTLPEAIEDAAVELVTSRFRRRGQDLRVVASAYQQSSYTFGGVPVPAEILAALAPYIRTLSP